MVNPKNPKPGEARPEPVESQPQPSLLGGVGVGTSESGGLGFGEFAPVSAVSVSWGVASRPGVASWPGAASRIAASGGATPASALTQTSVITVLQISRQSQSLSI